MRGKAWFVLLLLAGCAGGGSGSKADPVVAPPPTATERCHTAQLQARIASGTTTITVFSLIDTANVACVLEGYVRFELLDRNGVALGSQPTRLTDVPARRLTLTPGGAASFELHSHPTTAGGALCTLVTPSRVRITPPDENDALTVDAGGAPGMVGCEGQYGVTAMQAAP